MINRAGGKEGWPGERQPTSSARAGLYPARHRPHRHLLAPVHALAGRALGPRHLPAATANLIKITKVWPTGRIKCNPVTFSEPVVCGDCGAVWRGPALTPLPPGTGRLTGGPRHPRLLLHVPADQLVQPVTRPAILHLGQLAKWSSSLQHKNIVVWNK